MSDDDRPADAGALFTPKGAPATAPGRDFSGFVEEKERDFVLRKRIIDLEKQMSALMERVKSLESEVDVMKVEKKVWRDAYNDLHRQMIVNEKKSEAVEVKVKEMNEVHKVWKDEQEKENLNFKQIMEEQVKAKDEGITEKVIKVIKEKPEIVRDTVEKKKSLVIFGIKEENAPIRTTREKRDKEEVEKVINVIQEENDLVGEIEEVFRLGKYEEGAHRPIKIRLRSQVAAEMIVGRAWRLAKSEIYKGVWVKKDRSLEERNTLKDLIRQAKERNEARTEEEKKFFWRVMDTDLRKWYRREGGEA